MRSLAALGKPVGHYWSSVNEPSIPTWMTKAPAGAGTDGEGASYTVQDPATTGGGIILRPALRNGAVASLEFPKVTLGQWRAVRLRAVFTPGMVLGNTQLILGGTVDGGGARIFSRRYKLTPMVGVTNNQDTNYLDSRLNYVELDKLHDFSIMIDNTGVRRCIYTLQGDDIVDRWIPGGLMSSLAAPLTPSFVVSQHATLNADTRVTLRELSVERWR